MKREGGGRGRSTQEEMRNDHRLKTSCRSEGGRRDLTEGSYFCDADVEDGKEWK